MKCGPDNCPVMTWPTLSPGEQKAKRKEKAEQLYKQEFTMEQIAAMLGVSKSTIATDLEGFPKTGKPPRPKGGRPKGSKKPRKSKKVIDKHEKIIAQADAGVAKATISEQAGIGERMIGRVCEVENARREGLIELEALIGEAAAKNFSEKGQLKIADAIRVYKKLLEKAFERKVSEEVFRRIAAADDATRKQNKELYEENLRLRTMLNQRGVFSELQFKQLLMCVHPENSASVSVRNELLPFINKNRRCLVREQ